MPPVIRERQGLETELDRFHCPCMPVRCDRKDVFGIIICQILPQKEWSMMLQRVYRQHHRQQLIPQPLAQSGHPSWSLKQRVLKEQGQIEVTVTGAGPVTIASMHNEVLN